MKRIVTVILAVLLLAPGLAQAAEGKTTTPAPAAAAAAKTPAPKLDLNRATREELEGVPGVGPRMAQAIVELRARKGAFKKVEDLLEVTGIKEKKLAAIVGYVEVVPLQVSTTTTPVSQSK